MFNTKHVASRLYFLVALMSALMILMGVAGLKTMSGTVASLQTVYEDRTVPLIDLGKIQRLLSLSLADALRALQHDPSHKLASLHDHPVSEHIKRIDDNLAEMDRLWVKYMATYLTPEEKELAADYEKKYKLYVEEVLKPLTESLRNENYEVQVVDRFLKGNRKQGKGTEDAMDKLMALQDRVAGEEYGKGMSSFSAARTMAIASIIGGLMLGLGFAFWIIRSITMPLNQVRITIAEVDQNSDFTQRVEVSSEDEVGQTAKSFNQLIATMQETARSVLHNVGKVSDGVASLASSSNQVASSSIQQSEAASAMAASVEQIDRKSVV